MVQSEEWSEKNKRKIPQKTLQSNQRPLPQYAIALALRQAASLFLKIINIQGGKMKN